MQPLSLSIVYQDQHVPTLQRRLQDNAGRSAGVTVSAMMVSPGLDHALTASTPQHSPINLDCSPPLTVDTWIL